MWEGNTKIDFDRVWISIVFLVNEQLSLVEYGQPCCFKKNKDGFLKHQKSRFIESKTS